MAIETRGDNIRRLLLPQRCLNIGWRIGAVAHGQSRAITCGVPGHPVLEILAGDRSDWRDPANSRPKGPFERCRSALRAALDRHLNSFGCLNHFRNCRVLEPQAALLLNAMAD